MAVFKLLPRALAKVQHSVDNFCHLVYITGVAFKHCPIRLKKLMYSNFRALNSILVAGVLRFACLTYSIDATHRLMKFYACDTCAQFTMVAAIDILIICGRL